ncbi:hypothetical protein L873DRAFT_1821890 [Choiromyces venosus 120613-1]|uniref:Uncharacterized protein n=1 Tax=Choiromyces venosus 120613-1 TaxID=1336337 RepID=A0A3N4IW39_9PEZI|nr:hypothetical protein L873DRAFT_1821890 [Choiromyces venosus 120613-1]
MNTSPTTTNYPNNPLIPKGSRRGNLSFYNLLLPLQPLAKDWYYEDSTCCPILSCPNSLLTQMQELQHEEEGRKRKRKEEGSLGRKQIPDHGHAFATIADLQVWR